MSVTFQQQGILGWKQSLMVSAKLDGNLSKKLVSFICIGGVTTGGHYVVLVASVHGLGSDPILASSVGYAIMSVLNYYLNSRITFRYQKSHVPAFLKFLIVAAVGFMLNVGMMYLCVEKLAVHYLMAQAVSTVVVFGWNFFGNSVWSFR